MIKLYISATFSNVATFNLSLHTVTLSDVLGMALTGNGVFFLMLTSLLWSFPLPGDCLNSSKILVVPVDGSHWVNMEIILKELHSRGHNLTVMNSAKSWYIPDKSPIYTTIPMKSLQDYIDQNYYEKMLRRNLDFRRNWPLFTSILQQWDLTHLLGNGNVHLANAAMSMFEDKAYMAQLKETKYDMMLTDPAFPIGLLIGRYLNIPMVFNVRWINNGDSHFAFAPSPVSYIPLSGSHLPDQMTFSERIKNMLFYFTSLIQQHFFIDPPYRKLLDLYFPPGSTMLGLQQAADLWLVRSDFVFEFPRPTMPNVAYIGGFQCKPAKHLPPDMEDFMQSSGEHGVVIMSLGTIIAALPKEITEVIAAAFAELPQKVIWKYLGDAPSTLGNNTLLVKWFPQNDLLGHPKTRAFVSHSGTNGLYEAIYHGVPVLGLPLLFDQFDNALKLKARGAARVLEVATLTKDELLEALKDLLENPTYKKNIQRLSKLHHDQPVTALDSATFWIEYVLRHKGAPHLRTKAYTMPWYSYYSVDVAVLLLSIVVAFIWISVCVFKMLYHKIFNRKRKQE
ncbi:UDP-glucuronosyltransferase 2C1-like [Astyanax mexicanus]|uniref:UDP-glucuronosyltransferase 2C1-like n=1 Tax=Astyanax mexicanus TaxID=7994 RepID=A0A8B9KWE9_ASTMX|nr:UDP-glucuronosyltransferase 2C1-like [Astyanax mexicanus]